MIQLIFDLPISKWKCGIPSCPTSIFCFTTLCRYLAHEQGYFFFAVKIKHFLFPLTLGLFFRRSSPPILLIFLAPLNALPLGFGRLGNLRSQMKLPEKEGGMRSGRISISLPFLRRCVYKCPFMFSSYIFSLGICAGNESACNDGTFPSWLGPRVRSSKTFCGGSWGGRGSSLLEDQIWRYIGRKEKVVKALSSPSLILYYWRKKGDSFGSLLKPPKKGNCLFCKKMPSTSDLWEMVQRLL